MEKFVEFEIRVREMENKETHEKFNVYQALTKKGKWVDLRFTKDVPEEKRPLHNCIMVVDREKISVDKMRKFPMVWVSEIHGLKEFDRTVSVADYFD